MQYEEQYDVHSASSEMAVDAWFKFWRAFAIRKPVRAVDDIKFLTVEKQEKFLEAAKHSHNYRQYVLLYSNWQRVPAVCLNRATT